MTSIAELLATVDRDSRDALVLRVEEALDGYDAAEVFIVTTYFCALSIARMPCGDTADLLDDMPRILRSVISNELATVTRQ